MTTLRILPLLLLGFALAPAQEPKDNKAELKNLKGEAVKGDLVSISDKEIVLDAGGKKVATPLAEVVTLTLSDNFEKLGPEVKYSQVELSDGSRLKCSAVALKGKGAKLTLLGGAVVDVPLAQVAWILHDAHVEKNVKDFQERVVAKKKARDILAVKKNDIVNPLHGTLGDADDKGETIEFTTLDGTKRDIALDLPLALYFQRGPNPAAKPTVCRLTDTARNFLYVAEITLKDKGFTFVLSCGATVPCPAEKVARLDYSTGKLEFLSQLAPSSVVETSTEGSVQRYRRDENLNGETIRLAGKEYPKGLSLHATTELEYDLDGNFREFKAVAGIDDDVGGDDSPTVLKIYADNVEIHSWTVSRKDRERVKNLALNIKDVKKLKIVVTRGDGDPLDLGKHLTLGDAKVSK